MCNICGYKYGSTKHLLYWQKYFLFRLDFKKFALTWYHIFNRKAYVKWFNNKNWWKAFDKSLDLLYTECDGHEPANYLADLTPLEFYNEFVFRNKNENTKNKVGEEDGV